tara:strand:+ start:665 stop:979 length:315 start_codon:yes stop_codon:yes gene_type:complete
MMISIRTKGTRAQLRAKRPKKQLKTYKLRSKRPQLRRKMLRVRLLKRITLSLRVMKMREKVMKLVSHLRRMRILSSRWLSNLIRTLVGACMNFSSEAKIKGKHS